MKDTSVYLNPSADRNPWEKGKEQQIRRFAECQHSNDSEKYKTKQLTAQGNKCSCGKNHTLMPISLIALWFRQRAQRQGLWALCAAVLQPGCHLGGWILPLPLVIFAFSFATFQCKTELFLLGLSDTARCTWGKLSWAAGWRISPGVCTHCARDRSVPMSGSSSHSLSRSWRWVKVYSTLETSHSVPTPNPKCADVCLLAVGTSGAEPQSKKVKAKKTQTQIKWKQMAEPVQQRAGDNQQYQFTRKVYEGRRAKIPLEKR